MVCLHDALARAREELWLQYSNAPALVATYIGMACRNEDVPRRCRPQTIRNALAPLNLLDNAQQV